MRKIIGIKTSDTVYSLGQVLDDGYTIVDIEFRQQGLLGVNSVTNAGAQPSYLLTLVGAMSDKDKKFVVVTDSTKSVAFVEKEEKKQDNIPEPKRGS